MVLADIPNYLTNIYDILTNAYRVQSIYVPLLIFLRKIIPLKLYFVLGVHIS